MRGERALLDAVAAARTILTPNAELAAALSAAVERSFVAAGRDIWPTPQIHDFGNWLRQQYTRQQFIDPTLPRCLSDFEEREFWRAVVQDSASGAQFLEPNGAARAARRARRALFEYGIPPAAVSQVPSEETLTFLEWNRAFEARCREYHCMSADELLTAMPFNAQNLVFIDNLLWRPQARRWLERVGAYKLPAQTVDSASQVSVQASSPLHEAAAIAEWAHKNLERDAQFRAWVCIPDLHQRRTSVVDAFDAVLAPQRFSLKASPLPVVYAVAGGTALATFAPVRAALDLLAASTGSVSFDQFSSLLRWPSLHADSREESDAAMLDLELRRGGPSEARCAEWLALAERLSLKRLAGPPAALRRLRAALHLLDGVSGRQPMSRWVVVWIAALQAAPWSQRQRWSSTEYQAAERFRELLAALATADALFGVRSAAAAHRLLARAADDTPFQPQTGVPPIWVSSQLMDPWLTYDGLWLAGCSEEQWPPPVDPIPLLPVQLQREFGVVAAGIDSQLRFVEDLQARFGARAAATVVSCADPGDGRRTRPSPLIPAAAQSFDATPHPHWQRLRDRAPPLEILLDELAPPFAAGERTRGVATLRAQSLCAFRGFAETRLRTHPLERPLPGFNHRERGDLLHHALEHVWGELVDWRTLMATPAEGIDALLERSIAAAIHTQMQIRDPGTRWRDREQRRLARLLARWLEVERDRAPFKVERLEQPNQQLHYGGVDFSVRIDRIDELQDGARVLIDYKTGSPKQDWRGERPDNPQLPMYALLRPDRLVAVAYGKVNASECDFIIESERADVFWPRQKPTKLEELPDFAALVSTWEGRIEALAAAFAAGHAQVAPTPSACLYCGLQPLCRIPSVLDDDAEDLLDFYE